MQHEPATIDKRARDLAKQLGRVTYATEGMTAPQGGERSGPYATREKLSAARNLAKEKAAYLVTSTRQEETADPQSFLDVRDGGTDTHGLPGKPVMTGWLTYAAHALAAPGFLSGLAEAGRKIREDFSSFLVIGIGGSYTDIDGVISALCPAGTPIPIYFLGQHLSPEQYHRVFAELEKLPGKVAVNIISKSGTTTEPAIAARIVLAKLSAMGKLGAVFATTDPQKGALRELVREEGYNPAAYLPAAAEKEFYIGENIGGRFSAITPVGLFPYAVSGIDNEEFLLGYHFALHGIPDTAIEAAACRYAAFRAGASVGIFSYNLACLHGKILAFRQLWPESTGKNGQGLNIMEEFYTSDAHSNGQLIKSGVRNMMEIFHFVDELDMDFQVPVRDNNADKLNQVAGKISLHAINNRFMGALLLDHHRSGVPVTAVRIPRLTPFHIGMWTGIEHLACAVFGLMTEVNPVNQPGVQGYKELAFSLLGFKGRDAQSETLADLKAYGITD